MPWLEHLGGIEMSFKAFIHDLQSTKKLILLSTLLFGLSMGIGWFSSGFFQTLLEKQLEGLGGIARQLQQGDHPQWNFFVFIFFNNAIKCVLVIFLGALFGIIPFIFLVVNGMMIGFLIHITADQGQSIYNLVVKGLLPHGIIELPVLIIACAFGLKFGGRVFSAIGKMLGIRTRQQELSWEIFMRETLTVSIWTVILLAIAATIESTVTYQLVQH